MPMVTWSPKPLSFITLSQKEISIVMRPMTCMTMQTSPGSYDKQLGSGFVCFKSFLDAFLLVMINIDMALM